MQRASAHAQQSFHFQKIPGGLIYYYFLWKSAWCLLLHKRTNAGKQIRNLSFKNYYFGPTKKEASCRFSKKILKFRPSGIFWKWKLWRACVFLTWSKEKFIKIIVCFSLFFALNKIKDYITYLPLAQAWKRFYKHVWPFSGSH